MSEYDGFAVDRDGTVATVTLDVPGKLNRVSMAARDQLSAVFAELDEETEPLDAATGQRGRRISASRFCSARERCSTRKRPARRSWRERSSSFRRR